MTYRRTAIGKGVLVATLGAGPAGTLMLGLFAAISWPSSGKVFTWKDVAEIPFILLFSLPLSVPVGAIVAALPNLIGAAVLAALGGRYIAARNPLTWSATGGIAGAAIGWAMSGDPEPSAVAWFGVMGLICALICRWGTRWTD